MNQPGAAPAASLAVVIFSYNYARYLHQCIDSVLNQTTRFDQIIVVDDGSTDESPGIIRSYGDALQTVFQTNTGQTGAAIAALELVNSRYVYFLDSDDYAAPDCARTIRQYLASQPAGCADPVKIQFQLQCVSDDSQLDSIIPSYPHRYNRSQMITDNLITGFYTSPPTSGNVFLTETLRAMPLHKLDPSDPFDGVLMMCLPYLGDVRSISRIIANYRIHGTNQTMQNSADADRFERDLAMHQRRWDEFSLIVPNAQRPLPGTTVIEHEARCLAQLHGGERVELNHALGYCRQLMRNSITWPRKLTLGLLMLSLTVLPVPIGVSLVRARRSPIKRPYVLRRLLRFVLKTADHHKP